MPGFGEGGVSSKENAFETTRLRSLALPLKLKLHFRQQARVCVCGSASPISFLSLIRRFDCVLCHCVNLTIDTE